MEGCMRIGALNKLITIQYTTKVPNGMGGFTSTWADHDTAWAAIWPVSASEQVQAGQQVMTITHNIRIRYRSKFKPSWRIRFGDRYFAIVSVTNPNESNRWLDLMCKEAA